jgi:hypothetical protein
MSHAAGTAHDEAGRGGGRPRVRVLGPTVGDVQEINIKKSIAVVVVVDTSILDNDIHTSIIAMTMTMMV